MATLFGGAGRDALQELLERRWWLVALRGGMGLLFGILCFVQPLVAALSILLLFALFALVDGVLGLASAAGRARRGERWLWLALEGGASLVLGALVLAFPALGAAFLFLLITVKALAAGILLGLAALRLDGAHGRGWLLLAALANLGFGALLLLAPAMGVKILIWWIGAWALVFGFLMLLLGFTLRAAARRLGRLPR